MSSILLYGCKTWPVRVADKTMLVVVKNEFAPVDLLNLNVYVMDVDRICLCLYGCSGVAYA